MKRCAKCIMPQTAKGIRFDHEGVCQLCKDLKKVSVKGKQYLEDEISQAIEGASKYNCLVPVSGGRDSAYALYYAKQILGLRPIALNNDNDFQTEIAVKNLENITRNLKVPLICIKSARSLSRKMVIENFKMNASFGPIPIIDHICQACAFGYRSAAYNTARRQRITLIIWGDSEYESSAFYYDNINCSRPTKLQRLLSPSVLNTLKYKYYLRQLMNEYGPLDNRGLKEIHLYDYVQWDRQIILRTIQDKAQWSVPPDTPTSWRLDCSLVPIVNYLTKKAYGVSKLEFGFSNMIRHGMMSRGAALKKVKEIDNAISTDSLKEFLNKLHIPSSRIFNIVK